MRPGLLQCWPSLKGLMWSEETWQPTQTLLRGKGCGADGCGASARCPAHFNSAKWRPSKHSVNVMPERTQTRDSLTKLSTFKGEIFIFYILNSPQGMCNMFLISLVFKNVPYLRSEAGPQAVYSTDSELLIRWIQVIDSEHKHSRCKCTKYRLFGWKEKAPS